MKTKLGVIVGRFQEHTLSSGHLQLIQQVREQSDVVLICIGSSPVRNTKRNPLPIQFVSDMIMDGINNLGVNWLVFGEIKDIGNIEIWCNNLDAIIDDTITTKTSGDCDVTIYGSRDSVVSYYVGKYPKKYVESVGNVSSTEVRKDIFENPYRNRDFRGGIVYASQWRYATGHPTVDIACIRDGMILMGKKPNRDKYQLIGGFYDPIVDSCYEDTAKRELNEETGAEIKDLKYVGSFRNIWDFRYASEQDKIITTLFMGDYTGGEVKANDDIVEVKWMKITTPEDVYENVVIDHQEMMLKLITLL